MQINIKNGERTVKLTKYEQKCLRQANDIVREMARFDDLDLSNALYLESLLNRIEEDGVVQGLQVKTEVPND